VLSKGGERRDYGGTVTRHGFRKGDYVKAVKAGITYYGGSPVIRYKLTFNTGDSSHALIKD